jgi:hypothetical protein
MIVALGLLTVFIGAAVACMAERFPAHVEALETGAGALLVGGLALTGYALPVLL